ncbi:MAG: ATP-binding protein [Vicinamibacterales bacterium]
MPTSEPGATRQPRVVRNRLHAQPGNDAFCRRIVAAMRNGVLAITRDNCIALINDEAYRIFEIEPRPDDVGRPFTAVLSAYPEVVQALESAPDTALLANRAELRLKPSGKVIGYTLAHVHADSGDIIGTSMFFTDLTRVEQIEERERLRDRLAAVGEMAAAIAHEVKNPLGGIEVLAGLLRRKLPETADAQALLKDIINEAKMANAIVQEVLDFVRPIRLQVEPVSIAETIRAASSLADSKVARGATTLSVTLPEGLPFLQGDSYQLTQLFTNLLTNAYEALEGRGEVTITGATVSHAGGNDTGRAVRVDVSDSGPGMPQEIADKVFDPFFTTKAQGSGLGLAIVRKIVDAHDGRLILRTSLGGGTTVSVTIPALG